MEKGWGGVSEWEGQEARSATQVTTVRGFFLGKQEVWVGLASRRGWAGRYRYLLPWGMG